MAAAQRYWPGRSASGPNTARASAKALGALPWVQRYGSGAGSAVTTGAGWRTGTLEQLAKASATAPSAALSAIRIDLLIVPRSSTAPLSRP